MEHINDEKYENDIVMDTLSNLAKRSARREYFKRSLVICCAVISIAVALGGILYIKLSSYKYMEIPDFTQVKLPFSYGFKESIRRLLKLYSFLCLPFALQFVSGFTFFSPYVCIPSVAGIGMYCGTVLIDFTLKIVSDSAGTRLICLYVLYVLVGTAYCVASIYMACVSMSFCSSLKHNSRSSSRLNDGDTREYFSFFVNIASCILALLAVYCIGLYGIVLFK